MRARMLAVPLVQDFINLPRMKQATFFGLDHSKLTPKSLMNKSVPKDFCAPTAHDVVAVKALYQSHEPE